MNKCLWFNREDYSNSSYELNKAYDIHLILTIIILTKLYHSNFITQNKYQNYSWTKLLEFTVIEFPQHDNQIEREKYMERGRYVYVPCSQWCN